MSDETLQRPVSSDNSLSLTLNYISTKLKENFDESCLKQEKMTFTHKKLVNIFIVYETRLWLYTQSAYLS